MNKWRVVRGEWRVGIPVILMLLISVVPRDAAGQANTCQGLIEPSATFTLSPVVAGRLEDTKVDRGDRVKAGQVLIQLDSGVEEATVQLQKVRAEAEARKLSAREIVRQRKIDLDKKEKLFADGILSDKDILEARTLHRVAELDVQQADEEQRTAAMELKRAQEVLSQRAVKSPANGIVLKRIRRPGEVVRELEPVLTVVRLDPLWVETFCPKELFGKIRSGQEAEVLPEAPHNGRYRARVEVVDAVVEATSGTFGIRLEMKNPEEKIPAGIRCTVRFLGLAGPARDR